MKIIALSLLLAGFISGCGSNPVVGKSEPHSAAAACQAKVYGNQNNLIYYEQDGHLYTTLRIAQEAGLPPSRGLLISYYSQYPDIDTDYEATPVAIKYLLYPPKWEWRDLITGQLHSLHGGDSSIVKARRQELLSLVKETIKDPQLDWASGLLIHALGDSYAHTKNDFNKSNERAYGKIIGHAIPTILGKNPDTICHPKKNARKYLGYLSSLRKALGSNIETSEADLKEICDGRSPSSFGPTVDWAALKYENLENHSMKKFVHCMNQEVRQLTVNEVTRTANHIRTGLGK